MTTTPKNQILFGPPGTGKTYATINAALEILDPTYLLEQQESRAALKRRFDELVQQERIRFVTFHQSFSYEDFVEGLRASNDEVTQQLRYDVVDGVFKSLCEAAAVKVTRPAEFQIGRVFGRGYQVVRATEDLLEVRKPNGNLLAFSTTMLGELANAVRLGTISIQDIRDQSAMAKLPNAALEPYLVNGYNNILAPLVEYLAAPTAPTAPATPPPEARVLIIDEINRGNVSRIFGELITLIEPSKRAGAEEALSVVLPYSKQSFSVPDNVYLIGTMNTTDRSLAGLDIALRRRFNFREMPPQPQLLDDVSVEGVAIGQLLRVINRRIEVLLDRDHCLGHAYFFPLKADRSLARLEMIFRNQVLPLLQEYFFEDWERIGWVLNDQQARDNGTEPFVQRPSAGLGLEALFGNTIAGQLNDQRWQLNPLAFSSIGSYLNVLGDRQ